ncbi:MAG: hypothetical protein KDD34_01440 [Bdellovibrionales bacterium]|nr:hypothetical protein [Bdellovibrionales bacterium]
MFGFCSPSGAQFLLHSGQEEPYCTKDSPRFGVFRSLSEAIENKYQSLLCSEYKEGEVRRFETERDESWTGIPLNYAIQKSSANKYDVYASIGFVEFLERKAIDRSDIFERVEKCLESVNNTGILRTPDGIQINLHVKKAKVIFEDDESPVLPLKASSQEEIFNGKIDPNPSAQIIKISDRKRSHSMDYNENVNCSTIVHEYLHLLGLIDEYKETDKYKNFKDGKYIGINETGARQEKFDCRNTGPDDSIMSNPEKAFRKGLISKDVFQIESWICFSAHNSPENKEEDVGPCIKNYRGDKISDYTGAYEESVSQSLELGQIYNPPSRIISEPFRRNKQGDVYTVSFPKNSKNLSEPYQLIIYTKKQDYTETAEAILWPAQAKAIIYPGCISKNQKYIQCSKNFQRSSGATGCIDDPDYCNSYEEWMK